MASTNSASINRRSLLKTGFLLSIAGVGWMGVAAPRADAAALPLRGAKTAASSVALQSVERETVEVEGCLAKFTAARGSAGVVLQHVARRFNYEVMALNVGDVSSSDEQLTGDMQVDERLNAGMAISILPSHFVAGSAGNYFSYQELVIRDILLDCGGVVRWGGDIADRPLEGVFWIDEDYSGSALLDLTGKLTEWKTQKDEGAGALLDVTSPARLEAADALASEQGPI